MTASQAAHLIEQFAAQCPFAIWVLDSRGVAIFMNDKFRDMVDVRDRSTGTVGVNVLKSPAAERAGLLAERDGLMGGKSISLTHRIENPSEVDPSFGWLRTDPLIVRVVAYALMSSRQTVEHYVIFAEDVTESREQHEHLESQSHEIMTFLRSHESRKARLDELKAEVASLRERIRSHGQDPEA